MSMTKQAYLDLLRRLQEIRNLWGSLGLVPPDVSGLITTIENEDQIIKALAAEKLELQNDISSLKTARAQYAAKEKNYRAEYESAIEKLNADRYALEQQIATLSTQPEEIRKQTEQLLAERRERLSEVDRQITERTSVLTKIETDIERLKSKWG